MNKSSICEIYNTFFGYFAVIHIFNKIYEIKVISYTYICGGY